MLGNINRLFILGLTLTLITSCPTGEPSFPKSTISYVVDDYIESIAVNKNLIWLQPSEKSVYVGLAQLQLYLFPGDIISFTVSNMAPWSTPNPAFVLASINYFDKNGGTRTFSTGSDWTCDGVMPQQLGQNQDFQGSTYWLNKKAFPQIEMTAKMIWNPDHRIKTTCSFKIPCY